jgi:hypothetical protein
MGHAGSIWKEENPLKICLNGVFLSNFEQFTEGV